VAGHLLQPLLALLLLMDGKELVAQ
jgi:hypothetical protein